jgi:hypothetical protein
MTERRGAALSAAALALLVGLAAGPSRAAELPLSDAQIVAAYEYLLARALVARRQHDELETGLAWNRLVHSPTPTAREPGVLISDAWLGLDETSCTILTLPPAGDRYLNAQIIDDWGETLRNINPRTEPYHPSGDYALCLKGARPPLPRGAQRIELPARRARLRVTLDSGTDLDAARALQQQVGLAPSGNPAPPESVCLPPFSYAALPGLEIFDAAESLLRDAPDRRPGSEKPQAAVHAVAAAVTNPVQRARIDTVIQRQAIPRVQAERLRVGTQENGWMRWLPRRGDASSPLTRSVLVLDYPWANQASELVELTTDVDPNATPGAQAITFPAGAWPRSRAHGPWSLQLVDAVSGEPLDTPPRLIGPASKLQPNPNGALTLVFAAQQPEGAPAENWVPTPDRPYRLVLRFYAPGPLLEAGDWFPPNLHAY